MNCGLAMGGNCRGSAGLSSPGWDDLLARPFTYVEVPDSARNPIGGDD